MSSQLSQFLVTKFNRQPKVQDLTLQNHKYAMKVDKITKIGQDKNLKTMEIWSYTMFALRHSQILPSHHFKPTIRCSKYYYKSKHSHLSEHNTSISEFFGRFLFKGPKDNN